VAVISNLLVRVGVDESRVSRGIDRASRQFDRLRTVGERLGQRLAESGERSGRAFGDGFSNAGGRVLAFMGRATMAAGRMAGAFGSAAAPIGAVVSATTALLPLLGAAIPELLAVGKAAIAAGPALLALGVAGKVTAFALMRIFAEGSAARAALQPLADAIDKAGEAGSRAAARGIEPLSKALRRAAYPTVEKFFIRVGQAANVAMRNFLWWAKSANGLRAIRGILDPIGESLGRLAPQVSEVAIEFVAMLGRIMGVSAAAGERGLSRVLGIVADKLRGITAESVQGGLDKLASTFKTIKTVVSTAADWIGKLVAAYKLYTKEFGYVADAVSVLAIVFGGPVTAVIAAVGLIIRHFDQAKAVYERIKGAFSSPIAGGFVENLRTAAREVLPALSAAFDKIKAAVLPVLQEIWTKVKTQLIPAFGEFIAAVSPVVSWLVGVLGPVVASAFRNILKIVSGAIDIITGIFKIFTGILTGDWSKAWEGIKQVLSGAWQIILAVLNQALNMITAVFKLALGALRGIWSRAWDGMKALGKAAWDGIKALVRGGINGVKSLFSSGINGVKNAWSSGWNTVKSLASRAMSSLRSSVSSGISRVVSTVRGLPGRIRSALGNLGRLLYNAGRNVVQGLINGIKSMVGRLGSAMGDIAGKIRRFLPFSPAKEGPLSGSGSPDIAGAKIAEMVAGGMLSGTSAVAGAASGMAAAASVNASGTYASASGVSAAGGSGGAAVIEIRSGGTRLDDLLVEVLRRAIKTRGGNVQVVLGQRGT